MNLIKLPPKKSLNKAFLKVKPNRSEIELFKSNLIQLLNRIDEKESEEFHKNLISDFLKDTYYKNSHFINTKGRNDLVIHNGSQAKSSVGVILETKKPTNKSEMVSTDKLNTKAFHELVLYYLRERITHKNLEIKHLIISNIYEWFIFDAIIFDRLFAQNKSFLKKFNDFTIGRLADVKTDFFYREVVEPFISSLETEITFTYFNITDYLNPLKNKDKSDDVKLIALFKLLSPEHLLKQPFSNDSNSLDKRFYTELLHIIGLEETKEKSKKIIGRKKKGYRNSGSILEDTIIQLDTLDKLSRIPLQNLSGKSYDDRLFEVALQLSITWINRILFLKLLEGQLLTYNKGDKQFSFLNSDKIKNYDDLNKVFFQVLAKKFEDRVEDVKQHYSKIPYLNSSLFEVNELEQLCFTISQLDSGSEISVHDQTVLKSSNGNKLIGKLPTLKYLFDFLNAYDFGNEGSENIQEENKTIINASVLGLIFEKINGYKDGSIFTPGFITMKMCKDTIRKAVVDKFNEVMGWTCKNFEDLKEDLQIEIRSGNRKEVRKRANQIINSLKIVDPAVGSGHFLVSCLNELIAIKSELKILVDSDFDPISSHVVEVVNDELVIVSLDDELFQYNPIDKESLRIQKTIFHEKQIIIENCLFGVDINPNSVKICRLRLWIELLKNAYYKNHEELETLPNIDINIKCGNSLVSRFDLDADLSQALKKSKWSIDAYRLAVSTYRNAENKEQKREMERLISDIKSSFRTEISLNDKKLKKLRELQGSLFHLTNQGQLFELSKKEKAEWDKKVDTLTKEIKKLETQIEEIKSNKIYDNAFEWRFEFPEVLNDNGDFIGFDVVIGNPPYMRVQEIQASQPLQKNHYDNTFTNAKGAYDLANLFFELAVNISAINSNNSFIFPHKFFNSASSTVFRDYLTEGKFIDKIAHFGANMIFDDADTYTCIAYFSKEKNDGFYFQRFPIKSDYKNLMLNDGMYNFIPYSIIEKASNLYAGNQWILFDDEFEFRIFEKIYSNTSSISSKFSKVSQGIATGKDEIYLFLGRENNGYVEGNFINDQKARSIERGILKPFLKGKDVQRYSIPEIKLFILFPYNLMPDGKAVIMEENEIMENYPNAYQWLKETEKEHRKKDNKSTNDRHWYRYARNQGIDNIEVPKLSSMEICAIKPNVIFNTQNFYHNTKVYSWYRSDKCNESYEYLLAIANSKLLWWFLKLTGDTLQGDARTFKTNYLNPFPIPESVPIEMENAISEKVRRLLEIKKEDSTFDSKEMENEIDLLVYKLYNLTEEEINVIEKV